MENPSAIKGLSKAQKEAYINEYKGHVFEFLLAHELMKLLGKEVEFLGSIEQKDLSLLQVYQGKLNALDPFMSLRLPLLAQHTAKSLRELESFQSFSSISSRWNLRLAKDLVATSSVMPSFL